MNSNDEDDDKFKKARLLSVYNFKDRIGVLVIICVICLMALMIILSSQSVKSNYSSPLVHNTNLMIKSANEIIPRRTAVPIIVELVLQFQ